MTRRTLITKAGEIVGFVALELPERRLSNEVMFACKLKFTDDAAIETQKMIDELMTISIRNGKKKGIMDVAPPPYKIEGDDLILKFKKFASFTSANGTKVKETVKIIDAAGYPPGRILGITQGSIIRVAFHPYFWSVSSLGCGVTLAPEHVQVLKLVSYLTPK